MINRIDASLDGLIIHHIDNEDKDGCDFSKEQAVPQDGESIEKLLALMIDNFKEPIFYQFDKEDSGSSIEPEIRAIFESPSHLIPASVQIADKLFEASKHPNIKGGELIVARVNQLVIDDELVDAVCLVKVESIQYFLKLHRQETRYSISTISGVATDKIDKACIIFNTESEQGYKICAIDNRASVRDARFWFEDFLGIIKRDDDFYHTKNYIQMTKQFVKDRMAPIYDTGKAEEAAIMNRSLNFLTHQEDFDTQQYEKQIFKDDKLINDFREYKQDYASEQNVDLASDFKVSQAAVKNQSRVFKSILKLDKNFHVYIHGNRNMIEKGVDEMGRKYYKLYYQEEK